MFPYILTTIYDAGFRGRNTWLTFEPDLAQLQTLRERVTRELDAMGTALPADEWQLLLTLRHFVHKRLPHDGWKGADRMDAFTLLDQAESGAAYRCVEHGRLLCQVYQAFGIPARVLGLQLAAPNLGLAAGHVLAEAWLTAENRWVVMDSQMDSHWEQNGRPLSAGEIQQLVLTGRRSELRWAFADPADEAEGQVQRDLWASYFTHISCNSDVAFLSRPLAARRKSIPVFDYLTPLATPQFQFQGMPAGARFEADPAVFWCACNQVTIHIPQMRLLPDGQLRLELELEHCAPWFDRFAIEASGTLQQDGSKVTWTVGEGQHLLTVQTVNAMGRKGRPARVGFLFFPEESMAKAEPDIRAALTPPEE